jgi:hypothetical protein
LIDLIPVLKIEIDHISVESRKFYEEVITKPEALAETEEAI